MMTAPGFRASPANGMIPRLDIEMSDAARGALEGIGRTEDIRFSPDNRLLVIAGYLTRRCLILEVEIEADPVLPRVRIGNFMTLASDGMRGVHGIDFIADRTIAVANRMGPVSIIEIPAGKPAGQHLRVEPVAEVTRRAPLRRLHSPGSVAVRHAPDGTISLLVCSNYRHCISRHTLGHGHRVARNRVLLARGLSTPDGIAISPDDRWIAVTNHDTHDVALYPATGRLNRWTAPAGLLRGPIYPHGLRFTADGRHLLVANAGAPLVHIFERGDSWEGQREAVRTVEVLDDETFRRGRINPQEGGPKGIDIDRTGSVVALTNQEMPLAIFALNAFVQGVSSHPMEQAARC